MAALLAFAKYAHALPASSDNHVLAAGAPPTSPGRKIGGQVPAAQAPVASAATGSQVSNADVWDRNSHLDHTSISPELSKRMSAVLTLSEHDLVAAMLAFQAYNDWVKNLSIEFSPEKNNKKPKNLQVVYEKTEVTDFDLTEAEASTLRYLKLEVYAHYKYDAKGDSLVGQSKVVIPGIVLLRGDSSHLLITNNQNHVLLQKKFRIARGKYIYELPEIQDGTVVLPFSADVGELLPLKTRKDISAAQPALALSAGLFDEKSKLFTVCVDAIDEALATTGGITHALATGGITHTLATGGVKHAHATGGVTHAHATGGVTYGNPEVKEFKWVSLDKVLQMAAASEVDAKVMAAITMFTSRTVARTAFEDDVATVLCQAVADAIRAENDAADLPSGKVAAAIRAVTRTKGRADAITVAKAKADAKAKLTEADLTIQMDKETVALNDYKVAFETAVNGIVDPVYYIDHQLEPNSPFSFIAFKAWAETVNTAKILYLFGRLIFSVPGLDFLRLMFISRRMKFNLWNRLYFVETQSPLWC